MKAQSPPERPAFYREHHIQGVLSRFVEAVWIAESEARPFPGRQIVIPDGTANWIFNFGDPYAVHFGDASRTCGDGSLVVGVRSHSCLIEITGRLRLLGIRFRPGGLYAFVPNSASDLADRFIAAEIIFGAIAGGIESLLFDARRDVERVHLIERTLMTLKSNRTVEAPIQRAIDAVVQSRGLISIGKVADELDVGYKRLERGFQRSVGLTPKVLARTIRLLFVSYEALHRKNGWTTIAASNGFYDQAHLIAEMKQIVGSTPGSFTAGHSMVASVLSSEQRLSNFSNTHPL